MSRLDTQLLKVPFYVKASNPDNLIREMIRQNVKDGITHKYFDIQKQGQNWFAWYLADPSRKMKKEFDQAMNSAGMRDE